MKRVVHIDGRRTRRGALTTADGEVVNSSGTGRHWMEKIVLKTGDRIPVTDISNSGKHKCYWLSLKSNGDQKYDYNEDIECSVCAARDENLRAENANCS